MFDAIPPALFNGIGVVTVVLLVGWMIFTGRLVPRRTHDDIMHDRDEWRVAHRISEATRADLAKQVGELLEHARTTEALIRSLPGPGRGRT